MSPEARERRLRTIARIAEARRTADTEWSESDRQQAAESLGLSHWMPDPQDELELRL